MPSDLQVDNIKDGSATKTLATLSSTAVTLHSDVTFPSGHVIKWVSGDLSNTGTMSSSGTFGVFTATISSTSNDVLLFMSLVASKATSGGTTYSNLYVQGGGLNTGTSGHKLTDNIGYGDGGDSKHYLTSVIRDNAPTSTSVDYSWYFDKYDANFSFYRLRYTYAEVQG